MPATPSVLPYLIICPLVFLAGFVDAIAGGGGLISLPAYIIAGLPPHSAVATNKLSAAMGTTVSTIKLARAHYIPWKKAFPCTLVALVGSGLGARLALFVDADLFKRFMLIVLPITAFYVIQKKEFCETCEESISGKTVAVTLCIVFLIGIYDGLYGPGTGTFLIVLLTGLAHFPLGEANGMTKAINLTTNLTSLTVYLISGKTVLLLGFVAGLCGIVGNYIGITYFENKGRQAVRPIMLGVLVLFLFRILFEIL